LNGIISPVMLFFIVRLSGNGNVMGNFKTKKVGNFLGWATFVLISLVGIGAIISIII